jgi:hypothetical protein
MQRLQTSIATSIYRELDALNAARRVLPTDRPLNILSFGCSIGDELATLKILFRSATVRGCDIDELALGKAQETVGQFAEVFASSADEIARRGPYDLICAFSSLCINPLPSLERFRQEFPFALFAETIGMLDANLSPGGVLAVKNASYPVLEAGIRDRYTVVRSRQISQSGFVSVFNPSGALALSAVNTPCGPVHEVHDVSGLDDWDFIDSVFQKRMAGDDGAAVVWLEDGNGPSNFPSDADCLTWTRSNLDSLDLTGREKKMVDIRRVYRMAKAHAGGAELPNECDVYRSSVLTGEMMPINVSPR